MIAREEVAGRLLRGARRTAERRVRRIAPLVLAAMGLLSGCGLASRGDPGLLARAGAARSAAPVLFAPEPAARLGEAAPSRMGEPFREDVWRFRGGIGLASIIPDGNTDADAGFYVDGRFEWCVLPAEKRPLDVIVSFSGGWYTLNEGRDSTLNAFPFMIEGQVGFWPVRDKLRVYGGGGFAYFVNHFEMGPQDVSAGTLRRDVDDGYGPVFTAGVEFWSHSRPRVILGIEGKYFIESVDYVDTTAGGPAPGKYDLGSWVVRVHIDIPF